MPVFETANGWIVAGYDGKRYSVTIRPDMCDGSGTDPHSYYGSLASASSMTYHFDTEAAAIEATRRYPHASWAHNAREYRAWLAEIHRQQPIVIAPEADDDYWLSPVEAADTLGISPVTVRQHCRAHRLGTRIGRDLYLSPADVDAIRARVGQVGRPKHPAPPAK